MTVSFDHEKLSVYQEAIKFIAWSEELLETLPKNLAVYNPLDRAATSIPLNIAEGNGKYTVPDRCRFVDIARGSASGMRGVFGRSCGEKEILQGSRWQRNAAPNCFHAGWLDPKHII